MTVFARTRVNSPPAWYRRPTSFRPTSFRSLMNHLFSAWSNQYRAARKSPVPLRTRIIFAVSWTIGVVLWITSCELVPLGLSKTLVPGESELVEFEYIQDSSYWGQRMKPRPNLEFSRVCKKYAAINCPGQFQGVSMGLVSGTIGYVKLDEASTINVTIPRNYTAMFASATSDRGNTVSGLFDIQYRYWDLSRQIHYNKGQPYVRGASGYIGELMMQDTSPILKDGLVIDMTENPGIGFRNHTIPVGLEHGGTWSEDITWIEPVTQCADTNLSIELQIGEPARGAPILSHFIVDRGAFTGLNHTVLESPPWTDGQNLDLVGRAQKAARMHNVLIASSLKVSLPPDPEAKTIPKFAVADGSPSIFNFKAESTSLQDITGLGGPPPKIPEYSVGNTPDDPNRVKLLALDYRAIGILLPFPLSANASQELTYVAQICRGYDRVGKYGHDDRANSIANPAVQCGYVFGASKEIPASADSEHKSYRKDLYVCASGIKAGIKTIDFRYTDIGGDFMGLEVVRIADKAYRDEKSKPLWAVEHSYGEEMWFEPLWGIVDQRYEKTDGFDTLRAENLWLPTNPHLTLFSLLTEGPDALAAVSGYIRSLGRLYRPTWNGRRIHERFRKLSQNETTVSRIPSLILADMLANILVGTKTSYSTKNVTWPATLAVNDPARGFPQTRVVKYKLIIGYDIRFALPSIIGVAAMIFSTWFAIRNIPSVYYWTNTNLPATDILPPDQADLKEQPSDYHDTGEEETGGLCEAADAKSEDLLVFEDA